MSIELIEDDVQLDGEPPTLEQRIDDLTVQVRALKRDVEALNAVVRPLAPAPGDAAAIVAEPFTTERPQLVGT